MGSPKVVANKRYRATDCSSTTAALPILTIKRQEKIGAGEGIRTLDPNLGKVVLYP